MDNHNYPISVYQSLPIYLIIVIGLCVFINIGLWFVLDSVFMYLLDLIFDFINWSDIFEFEWITR